MKLLSSFDTEFKTNLIKREQEIYGKDRVFLIQHGKFYYYVYIIIPSIIALISLIIYYSLMFYFASNTDGDVRNIIYLAGFVISVLIVAPILFGLLKKYIDYIMDFVIVTPKNLISYNQDGLFTRKGRTVDVEKIKTISVNKDGIIRSIFNFGNIVILTEGDEKGTGEINFGFIDDPDNVKFKIMEIIEDKA